MSLLDSALEATVDKTETFELHSKRNPLGGFFGYTIQEPIADEIVFQLKFGLRDMVASSLFGRQRVGAQTESIEEVTGELELILKILTDSQSTGLSLL